MAVSEQAYRPEHAGRSTGVWIAMIVLVAAGIALAWFGASPLRGETTASGLRIRTVEKGTGPFLQPVDAALVDYEVRLPDGTVLDSSTQHGGPQPMVAQPGALIPGVTEALLKMQKGGRYKVHVPAKLAYGANPPAGAPIPPNADLDFDMHIVEIAPNAAMMMMGRGGSPEGQPQQSGPPPPPDQQPPQQQP
jgi:FKBP-type peptidyl-prolyl cis-trans isomerase FkpA